MRSTKVAGPGSISLTRSCIFEGDALRTLARLPTQSVQAVVTSPPYWGLRDYAIDGQIGLEETLPQYLNHLVAVFAQVRRVLKDDGTIWLNIGDGYTSGNRKWRAPDKKNPARAMNFRPDTPAGLKPKDLMGIPWRLAFKLQEDGWYLRQDIIWCISGGSWVYAHTQKGVMPVMVKDLVRLNPATVKLWNGVKWTQVLGWNMSTTPSQRIELVLRSGERVGCTGWHRWPTQRGDVAARDLRVGDVIRTCRLPAPDMKTPSFLTNDLLWLIGLYLAEGSRAGNTIQLALNVGESTWLPQIKLAAESLGASMTTTTKGKNLNVRLYGRVLVAAIEECIGGRTALNKHLRAVVWRLPDNALKLIATGYFDGDGHYDEFNKRIRLGFSRNYALERDLRTLAARLGATLTLHPTIANYQGGSKPAFRGEWRWVRGRHHNQKDRGEVIEIRASRARQFWDIGVEDEPHLFALASGVLTHNSKPNAMPESVKDRPTRSHEYLFLLSKNRRYLYDHASVREKNGRNRRSVWNVNTQATSHAHFAVFPPALIEPCILASTRPGEFVLDPFFGSGTVGVVCEQLGRRYVGIEIHPEYVQLAMDRLGKVHRPTVLKAS